MQNNPKKLLPLIQHGFSLVEIMVGLIIGLLATLVIMQVFSVFEGQKRSTTGNADAQTNGSIALYSIQRDTLMAGYGLPIFDKATAPLKQCTTMTPAGTNISPVTIVDGGTAAGASDSIVVRYGDTDWGGAPVKMVAGTATPTAQVNFNRSCIVGNSALVINGSSCTLTTVSAVSGSGVLPATITLADGTNTATNASVSCLGNWTSITYSVIASQLNRNVNGVDAPVVPEIINIQAQYGISSSVSSNQVTSWVNATGATWAAPTPANRNLIKAIRVAVVARNNLQEKDDVISDATSTCTTAKGTVNNGPCAWDDTNVASAAPKIDLTNNTDWKKFRYRVFDVIIPLRNIIWSAATL